MCKVKISTLMFLSLLLFSADSAFANKQRYERHYQKKTVRVQKKKPYIQELNVPNSFAYFEVSRKMPKVSVEYQPQETAYQHEKADISCNGVKTLSCTRFSVDFSVKTDCETSRISLTVTETQPMTVELSSLYPKGDCFFDRILKHELSHADIYKTTLDAFIKQAVGEIEATYASGQKKSKKCDDIRNNINTLVEGFSRRYSEEAGRQNAKKDFENGEHNYLFEGCPSRMKE